MIKSSLAYKSVESDPFGSIKVYIETYVRNTEGSNIVSSELEFFKLWNQVVEESPEWLQNLNISEVKNIVHSIYGVEHNYKPAGIRVSNYSNITKE